MTRTANTALGDQVSRLHCEMNQVERGINPATAPRRFFTPTPRRYDMLVDEMNLENVRNASTISLLRARARDLYAHFGRYAIARYPEDKNDFDWSTPEGHGTVHEREQALWKYINGKLVQIRNIRREGMSAKEWRESYKRLNREGGELIKRQRLLHQAIVTELLKRPHVDDIPKGASPSSVNQSNPSSIRAHDNGIAQATRHAGGSFISGRNFYPDQYDEQLRRIELRQQAEDMGIRSPTPHEKRIATRNRAYQSGDFDTVVDHDKDIEWHRAVDRAARLRHKKRKRNLRQYIRCRGYNAVPDPRSDDEDDTPVA